ncbi:hypothetical protein HMPREF1861_00418 [Corynebacterium kroppenstedtii]|nr:hypothetical protein HMPREF1861_00418 [Corynebacterium kroppenstedtii]
MNLSVNQNKVWIIGILLCQNNGLKVLLHKAFYLFLQRYLS